MKKEVELKFFVSDFLSVRKKLRLLGAKLEWSGNEKSWYFDTPTRMLKNKHAVLRLRTTNIPFITYKEKISGTRFKIADEYQLAEREPKEFGRILERIGFVVCIEYTKRREYWKLPHHVEVTLDTIPGRKIIEIEATPRLIPVIAKKLGIDQCKTTTQSYLKLLRLSY